jgi:release factor glutamine methyltransferase
MSKTQETWTILKILTWTREYLAGKGVENARLEAEWLLCEVIGLDRLGLYLNFDKPLSAAELAGFRELVSRRARREPLQYILGSQEFMGLEFAVSPAVLIPRHDTGTLVAEAVRLGGTARRVLDIGMGSGCIAVALAKFLPGAVICGVERSAEALALALRNAQQNGVTVTCREGSLFEPFTGERFDLIVSNPPYIPTGDLAALQPEVRDFEPVGALDGGIDGLDFYRAMIPAAPDFLEPDGLLLFEAGIGQSAEVVRLFETTGRFGEIFTARDEGGIERVIGGRLL